MCVVLCAHEFAKARFFFVLFFWRWFELCVCVYVNGLAGCNDNRFNVPLYFSKSRDYNVTGTAGKDDVVDSLCVADPFILEVLENTSAARRVLCRFCYASLRNELFPFRVSS